MRYAHCKLLKIHGVKLFATGLMLFMLVVMALSVYHYYENRSQVMEKIDQRLFSGATALRYALGDPFHNHSLQPQSSPPQNYQETVVKLRALSDALGLKGLYTLVNHDNLLYLTMTSRSDDLNKFLARYDDASTQGLAVYAGDTPYYFDVDSPSESYRSVLIPCVTTHGYRYLIGADLDVNVVNSALAGILKRSLNQCGLLLLLSFPLTALFVVPLKCQLYTHELTGLPNRSKLKRDLESCRFPLLILINIDSFKDINNYYGVHVGDRYLVCVAECIQRLIPAGTSLYKMDSDEYALLCESSPQCLSVDFLISHINEQRIEIEQTQFRLSVTAGVAQGGEQLIEHADLALKEAKRVLKPFKFYSAYLHTVQNSRANLLWTYKLKDAIDGGRMVAYFQAIYDNKRGVISHYEALIRLVEADGTVVSPPFFMEAARRSRVYSQLTLLMLDSALLFIRQHDISCTVNLLSEDIVVEESRQKIIDRIRKDDAREQLIFEIVESEGIENYDVIRSFIDQVRVYGVRVAIDDFGTGYSNFDHISQMDIDYIKIDGSLIAQLNDSARSKTIVEAIIHFAKELNIKTIAEYVSDESLQRTVAAMGIDYSQGYFWGKPQPDAIESADPIEGDQTVS